MIENPSNEETASIDPTLEQSLATPVVASVIETSSEDDHVQTGIINEFDSSLPADIDLAEYGQSTITKIEALMQFVEENRINQPDEAPVVEPEGNETHLVTCVTNRMSESTAPSEKELNLGETSSQDVSFEKSEVDIQNISSLMDSESKIVLKEARTYESVTTHEENVSRVVTSISFPVVVTGALATEKELAETIYPTMGMAD